MRSSPRSSSSQTLSQSGRHHHSIQELQDRYNESRSVLEERRTYITNQKKLITHNDVIKKDIAKFKKRLTAASLSIPARVQLPLGRSMDRKHSFRRSRDRHEPSPRQQRVWPTVDPERVNDNAYRKWLEDGFADADGKYRALHPLPGALYMQLKNGLRRNIVYRATLEALLVGVYPADGAPRSVMKPGDEEKTSDEDEYDANGDGSRRRHGPIRKRHGHRSHGRDKRRSVRFR